MAHLDEALSCPRSQQQQQQHQQQQDQKKPRPQPDQALKCPRCDSTNTKFCYYNNYSLSQPRYFCKGCRRYWTKGGSLRNVPVGGGCRKNNKRSSSSSSSSSSNSSSKKSQDIHQDHFTAAPLLPALPLPPLSFDPNDLTLAFGNDSFMLGNTDPNPNPNPSPAAAAAGFLDILRSGVNNPSGAFQNGLYYGFGGNAEEVEAVGGDCSGLMMFPNPNFDGSGLANSTEAVTTTTTAAAAATTSGSGSGNAATIGHQGSGSCKGLVMEHNDNNIDAGGGENKVLMMGLNQWPLGGDLATNNNLGLDSARDYWNGAGGGSWHGLINSSLM